MRDSIIAQPEESHVATSAEAGLVSPVKAELEVRERVKIDTSDALAYGTAVSPYLMYWNIVLLWLDILAGILSNKREFIT